MAIQVVILAAGQGKRMYSHLPKVMHRLAGKPLLEHVVNTAQIFSAENKPIIIYGHQGETVRNQLSHLKVHWVEQREQLGTGHAVLQALPEIADDAQVLILYGDVPLISQTTLKKLIAATSENEIGILTANLPNPSGYGRIKRDPQNKVIGVVEEKDASAQECAINEINSGIYLVPANYLKQWLAKLENKNAQNEYYLTDIIPLAVKNKIAINTIHPATQEEVLGVNDRMQLAKLERFYQHQQAENLMQQGVGISDPARFDLRGELKAGRDVVIDVNVIIEGKVILGDECIIGANCILRNVEVGARVEVKANSIIDEAKIAADCIIGPFARIRPGTVLAMGAHIGNFVEIKNSQIGASTKINHLSYVGDSEVGKRVNIGAGTITCNYDGVNKHKTIIGDDVQIGSDTQLVAPVKIGDGAYIGAGSTVVKDAPPQQLTLTHELKQRSKKDWKRPEKK